MTTAPSNPTSFEIDGRTVTMPVHVREARQAAATFLVDAHAAQRVIDATGLRVATKATGKAIASIALIDYLDNDLGTYHELALAFLVADPPGTPPAPKGSVSTYIHRLPVSEEFTCAAGRAIWGFPKWVAPLQVAFDERGATATLTHEGADVVRVTMRRGPIPLPRRPLSMNAYSCDDSGVVRRTPWTTTTRTGHQRVRPGGTTVEIFYGHPMCDELRALGLPKNAVVTMFDDHMQATFESPVVV